MKASVSRSTVRRIAALLSACLLTLSLAAANVQADSFEERRVRSGARLFRSMLAADTRLEQRRGADGRLHVLLYALDPQLTREIGPLIAPADAKKAQVRGMPIAVETTLELPVGDDRPAGIYLASRPSDAELDRLIAWSIAHRVIVYSPFEGHVERGVAGGVAIEAKVQPYVNLATLKASGIELKPLFMKVAKVHP